MGILYGLVGFFFLLSIPFVIGMNVFEFVQRQRDIHKMRRLIREATERIQSSKGQSNEELAAHYYDRACSYRSLADSLSKGSNEAAATISEGIRDYETVMRLYPIFSTNPKYEYLVRHYDKLRQKQNEADRESRREWLYRLVIIGVVLLAFFTNPGEDSFRTYFIARSTQPGDSELANAISRFGTTAILDNVFEVKHKSYFLFSICDLQGKGMDVISDKPVKRYVGIFTMWYEL